MQIDLTGKKALVTGASRGLGRAIALSLARAGADVIITYEKSADKAQAVADEIKALGRHSEAVQADSASALVHPGPTNSDMNPEDGEQADSQRQLIALGHYGQPEDVAAAVTFLASPAAGQISGTGLDVDGGLNA